jgi:hypothetical protein
MSIPRKLGPRHTTPGLLTRFADIPAEVAPGTSFEDTHGQPDHGAFADAFQAACSAFLDECLDPGLQRIVLLDASAAIGWEGIRRLEAPLLELMELAISRAAEAGRIAKRPPGPLAHFLFGAICEMAMVVARADDQKTAHRQAVGEIAHVLDGLAL